MLLTEKISQLNYQENFEHIIEIGKTIDIRHSSSSIMQENFYD